MRHLLLLASAAVALTLAPGGAFADPPRPSGIHQQAEPHYPMPSAEFQAHWSRHIEHARARMEEHIAQRQLTPEQASEVRTRFNAAVDQLNAKITEVCSDGTVTLEEAESVHALARSLLHHWHHTA